MLKINSPFNYKEHFSIIYNISWWCIALLNNSFLTSCNTNFWRQDFQTAEKKFSRK